MGDAFGIAALKERARQLKSHSEQRKRRLNARDESNLLRQLSLMMDSGFQFFDGLHLLGDTMEGPPAQLCTEVAQAVRTGSCLSRAFVERADRLSHITPFLVAAGEDSGNLSATLRMAAQWAESSAELLAKVKTALIYPCFILLVNIVMSAAMLVYVLPAFTPMFEGKELPLVTSLLLGLSRLCQSPLVWVVAILVVLEAYVFLSKPEAYGTVYRLATAIPVLSALLRSAARARFAGVLELTTRTGLSLVRSLSLAAQSSGDPNFIELDFNLQKAIRNGESIGAFFKAHKDIYGAALSQGMLVCEETGEIEKMAQALARFYQVETDIQVDQFKALIEPLLMMLVAGTTATVLFAIYLPLAKFVESLMAT